MFNWFALMLCLQAMPSEMTACHSSLQAFSALHELPLLEQRLGNALEERIDRDVRWIGVTAYLGLSPIVAAGAAYSLGVNRRLDLTFPLGSVNVGIGAWEKGLDMRLELNGIQFP